MTMGVACLTPALSPDAFDHSLQNLIANFFSTRQTEVEALEGFQQLIGTLAHELGRVDAAARLHGIDREESLNLLREHMVAGKRKTLAQHEKGCDCQASKMLQAELDLH